MNDQPEILVVNKFYRFVHNDLCFFPRIPGFCSIIIKPMFPLPFMVLGAQLICNTGVPPHVGVGCWGYTSPITRIQILVCTLMHTIVILALRGIKSWSV